MREKLLLLLSYNHTSTHHLYTLLVHEQRLLGPHVHEAAVRRVGLERGVEHHAELLLRVVDPDIRDRV